MQLAQKHDGYQLAPFSLKNRKLEQEELRNNNTFLFLTLVPPEPGENSWKVTCTILSCATVLKDWKEMTSKLKKYFKFVLGMENQFLKSLLVQYSLESQKAKIAMAESKPQISDYIQVEGKAVSLYSPLSHSNTSL